MASHNYDCRGSLGSPNNRLYNLKDILAARNTDTAILQFPPNLATFENLPEYCHVSEDLKGENIVAYGFHGTSENEPSVSGGKISTVSPDGRGFIETDATTVQGKSGGPVFLEGTNTLVGIIVGADFDATGVPKSFQIQPLNDVRGLDGLRRSSECNEIGPSGIDLTNRKHEFSETLDSQSNNSLTIKFSLTRSCTFKFDFKKEGAGNVLYGISLRSGSKLHGGYISYGGAKQFPLAAGDYAFSLTQRGHASIVTGHLFGICD